MTDQVRPETGTTLRMWAVFDSVLGHEARSAGDVEVLFPVREPGALSIGSAATRERGGAWLPDLDALKALAFAKALMHEAAAAVARAGFPVDVLDGEMVAVFCLDALEFMSRLADQSVDAIVMDPPYASGGFSETGRLRARAQGVHHSSSTFLGWFRGDNMGTAGIAWLMRAMAVEAGRVLRPGGSLVVFVDHRQIDTLKPAIESAGVRYCNLIVWDKGHAGMGQGFRARHECALQFIAGSAGNYHATDVGNVITCAKVPPTQRDHDTEKPVPLLREIIRTVAPPGGIVVDPFCGSGSCGEAARLEGRRWIGNDIERKHAENARRRAGIAGPADGLPLFDMTEPAQPIDVDDPRPASAPVASPDGNSVSEEAPA